MRYFGNSLQRGPALISGQCRVWFFDNTWAKVFDRRINIFLTLRIICLCFVCTGNLAKYLVGFDFDKLLSDYDGVTHLKFIVNEMQLFKFLLNG
jgi:hypothetical protein